MRTIKDLWKRILASKRGEKPKSGVKRKQGRESKKRSREGVDGLGSERKGEWKAGRVYWRSKNIIPSSQEGQTGHSNKEKSTSISLE